jgi:hypothetical protein
VAEQITFGTTRRWDSWQGGLALTAILRDGVEVGSIIGRRAPDSRRWEYEWELRSEDTFPSLPKAKEAALAALAHRRKR